MRHTRKVLLRRRTELERERESGALLAAAQPNFLLTNTLGRGDLHVCICVSRAVCIVMELELSLRFPSHGSSTRSHVPAMELEFFQVPFSRNLNIVQYSMYILNSVISLVIAIPAQNHGISQKCLDRYLHPLS